MVETIELSQLAGVIKAEEKRIEGAIRRAIQDTAVRAVRPIRERAPKAFGELRESVMPMDIGSNPTTGVYAPHAGAVEIGSPPHIPDWDELLAWVKLRGLQGLTRGGRLRRRFSRSEGPTTPRQARSIARQLKSMEVRGRRGVGRHLPIVAPETVARNISRAIQKNGTPPHHFVRDSLQDIRNILDYEMKKRIYVRDRRRR